MPRIVTFDIDAIEEIDALYLIDLLNDLLQCDEITRALGKAAYDIADNMDGSRADDAVFSRADAIYPQPHGSMTWHQALAKRAEHLRRFGFLKDVAE